MHTQLKSLIFIPLLFALALSGCSREGSSQQAQDYLSRAEAYRDQGQYRAAMIEATNAVNASPSEPQYAVFMAELYNTMGSSRRASGLLEQFLPDFEQEVALALAEAYLSQGRFLSAEEALEPFEPQSSEHARQKRMYQADIARMRGQLEQSEADYKSILEDYPDSLEIKLRLAENHIFRGQSGRARDLLSELREDYPESPKVFHVSGVIAYQNNQYEQADDFLTQALMHVPSSDVMLPERAAILQLLSETLTALGRTTEAMVYTRVLAEESPDNFEAQQQLDEAIAAAERGDLDQAEAILESLLEESPGSRSASLMLGMVRMNQGNLEGAEALLSTAVDVETASTEVIQAMAMAQAQTGNLEQALASLERSLRARPDQPVLLSIYGTLALESPEHEEQGYLSLQKALSQDPHQGGIRLTLARYHLDRDQPEQAMAQLRTAFQYQPADWPVTNVYIDQLLVREDWNEMREALAELEDAAPGARQKALYESQYNFRRGNEDQAVRQLQQLTQREPNYARAHGVLAQMYYEQGRVAPALAALERVLVLEPQNMQALQAGISVINENDADRSPHDWLSQLGRDHASLQPSITASRAMLYRQAQELEEAVSMLRSYEGDYNDTLRQTQSLIYRDRSRQLASQGDFQEARSLLMTALESFPDSRSLNIDLVRLDTSQGRYQEAEVLLEDLSERYPEDPEIELLQVRMTQRQQGDEPAYAELRQIWDERPNSQYALLLLNLARSADPDAVPEILQEWERIAPDERGRLLYVAEEYQRQEDPQEAISTYETILTNNPQDPVALNNLAWMLKDRDLPRALELAEQAAELQPNSAPILDTYGWLLHLSGDRTAALEHLERAASLAPNVDDIQRNLEAVRDAE